MKTTEGKKLLAELMGLHAACGQTDKKLRGAAEKIHEHHVKRAATIGAKIAPMGRDDDLEEDYLDSVLEKGIASRY